LKKQEGIKPKINFYSPEVSFNLKNKTGHRNWILQIISAENKTAGELSFIFCTDEFLHSMNLQYLNHDTLTDIITFDYTADNTISGEIFISIERVRENALKFNTEFNAELLRVMSHGVLHLCGYKDKTKQEKHIMRSKEDSALALFEQVTSK
jgi:probable rRNA maturation factor